MRALINASSFGDRPSGARSRFESLYPRLFRAMPEATFTLIVSADYSLPEEMRALGNLRILRLPFRSANRLLRRAFFALLPLAAPVVRRFDLIEDLSQPPSLLRARRRLLTVHDIRRLEISTGVASRVAYRLSLWLSERLGYDVVTVSQGMARQLAGYYPVDRIYVIENSMPALFLDRSAGRDRAARRHDAEEPFVLAVGHFEARKNYLRLVEAFDGICKGRDGLRLVIVGKDNGAKSALEADIAIRGIGDRVELLSDISDDALLTLYRSAEALVFPSFYEGFGIPLLEAMATACPMAISDIAVFREIAGEAALYFDPHDAEAIRGAIERLLDTGRLGEDLAHQGKARIAHFLPDVLAGKLAALYSGEHPA